MKEFHRGRGGREGGGFRKAGRGDREGGGFRRPGGGKPAERGSGGFERGGFKTFRRREPEERFQGGFNRGPPGFRPKLQMHEAVCAKCGERCEVPFKPSPSKPVYCSSCFQRNDPKRPTNINEELNRINDKLDRILGALHLD